MDLICAGITCFNAEGSIERAVASAQAQTWPSLEIIVVDDCSTDGSLDVLERLSAKDPRIRVIRHHENRGVGAARNTVLENATGEFVVFFDDDDSSLPERIAVQYERITEYERDTGERNVVCYTATERLFPGGEKQYSPCLGMDVTPAPSGTDVARLVLLGKPVAGGGGACPTSSLMARRDVFGRIGGFDGSLRRQEDTDFNLRLALEGGHFAGVSRPLVEQTMTFTGDKSVVEERRHALILIEKHRSLLEQWGWYRFCRSWWDFKYTKLERGTARALPSLARLALTSPLRTVKKISWALPHRGEYRRYDHSAKTGGG